MKYILFGFLLLISLNLYSNSYAFVNLNYLIENNKEYIEFLEQLKVKENTYKKEIEEKEKYLKQLKNEIDTGSLILTDNELQNKINEYNLKLENFNEIVNQINLKMEDYIMKAKKLILSNIRNILIEIAKENNYDFILDENNILIVDNKLDITKKVSLLLNETNIQLEEILKK